MNNAGAPRDLLHFFTYWWREKETENKKLLLNEGVIVLLKGNMSDSRSEHWGRL